MSRISTVFSILKPATPAERIAKAVRKGRMPSVYAEDLARVENPNVREALTEQLAKVANKTSPNGQMQQAQINEITWKLEVCDDAQIKTLAEELLIGTKGKLRIRSFLDLFKAEHLLDVVNTANGNYCRRLSHKRPVGDFFIDTIRKKIQKFYRRKDAEKLEHELQAFEESFSEPRKISRIKARKGLDMKDLDMRNETQFASLREFIDLYPEDKETATYLWRKYFVSIQEPKFQKIMNEIYDNYGVRVVANKETSLLDLIYLKNEFKIYKTASKGEAKFPALFDIRDDYHIIQKNVVAHTNSTSRIVNSASSIRDTTPRHEMAHMQDSVLERKKVKVNENDREELLNAGISRYHTDYFFKNEKESWAVFAEGDMSKYSEEFKQKMINKKKGLPAWITSLTPNSELCAYFKMKYPGAKNERMIDKIYEWFGDDFLSQVYIPDQQGLKFAYRICKKLPKDKPIDIEEFQKLLWKKIFHTDRCKQKAMLERTNS